MKRVRSNLTLWQRAMASLVWGCCRLIGAMPHWLRYYVLQDTIYFIVYKCLRYRVGDGEPAQFVSRPSDGRNQADSPVVLP